MKYAFVNFNKDVKHLFCPVCKRINDASDAKMCEINKKCTACISGVDVKQKIILGNVEIENDY
jgi:hypothetical protein